MNLEKKNNDLKKFVNKAVLIINKEHPHYNKSGNAVSYSKLATGGYGLEIRFKDKEGCFVFDSSEIKLIIPEENKDLADLTLTETIERLSAVNYSYDEMSIYVGMKKSAFRKEANTEDSPIWIAIQKGKLESEFEINDKLFQNAKSGNITAAQIVQKIKEEKRVENLKATIFYGE